MTHINYELEADKRTWWLNNTGGAAKDNITVRDYFAAKALVALLAGQSDTNGYYNSFVGMAEDSYELADEMMKARILDNDCRESRLKAERMAQAGEAW